MQEPVGIFTMTWRLVKQIPDLYNLVMQYLGPLLGAGGVLSQIFWMIALIKVIIPFVFKIIDMDFKGIGTFLDFFEK